MKVFSIIGWSGSGKTTLITLLIQYFKSKKRRVIAVKSTHAGFTLQPEGKDTARFLHAGALEAYLLAQGEMLRMTPFHDPGELLAELGSRLRPDDIVLLEGLCQPGVPMIEVEDSSRKKALKSRPEQLAAVIGTAGNTYGRPCFPPDHIAAIGAFMEEYREQHN